MYLIDHTLPTTVENIALDEALLLHAEQQSDHVEYLRIWEPEQYAIVMGRSGRVVQETEQAACQHDKIPILRRASGGGTVLTGPGCLMYALILNHQRHPLSKEIQSCHDFVLSRMILVLQTLNVQCQIQGTSDLTTKNRKISGNSLRLKRNETLYHGTLLCHFDLQKIPLYLKVPPRKPAYRDARAHLDFVDNLNCDLQQVKQALIDHWTPGMETSVIPQSILDQLLDCKYQDPNWHC